MKKPKSKAGKKAKIQKTMHEFKHGNLHSGSKSGPKVTNPEQAIAIALSQAGKSKKKRGTKAKKINIRKREKGLK